MGIGHIPSQCNNKLDPWYSFDLPQYSTRNSSHIFRFHILRMYPIWKRSITGPLVGLGRRSPANWSMINGHMEDFDECLDHPIPVGWGVTVNRLRYSPWVSAKTLAMSIAMHGHFFSHSGPKLEQSVRLAFRKHLPDWSDKKASISASWFNLSNPALNLLKRVSLICLGVALFFLFQFYPGHSDHGFFAQEFMLWFS